jgi:hypothetical protein
MTKKPAKAVLDPAGLYALYAVVGKEIAAVSKTYGEDAVAPARASFRMIQIQDATSTEAKREQAEAILLRARGQLAAVGPKKP